VQPEHITRAGQDNHDRDKSHLERLGVDWSLDNIPMVRTMMAFRTRSGFWQVASQLKLLQVRVEARFGSRMIDCSADGVSKGVKMRTGVCKPEIGGSDQDRTGRTPPERKSRSISPRRVEELTEMEGTRVLPESQALCAGHWQSSKSATL
jgi:hypothetical protein